MAKTSAHGIIDTVSKIADIESYQFLAVTGTVTMAGFFVNERGKQTGPSMSGTVGTTTPKRLQDFLAANNAIPNDAVGWRGSISAAVYYDTFDGLPASNVDFKTNPSNFPQFTASVNTPIGRVGGTTTVEGGLTVNVTTSGTPNTNVTQFGGNAVVTGTGVGGAGIPRVTVSSDSVININSADTVVALSIASATQSGPLAMAGYYGAGVTLTGTWSATVIPQISNDGGTTWTSSNFINVATGTLLASVTSNGNYAIQIAGGTSHVRLNVTPYTSGTITGNLRATISQTNGFDTIVQGGGLGVPGTAVPGTAIYNGTISTTALPSPTTAGNLVGTASDKFGRVIVIPQSPRDNTATQETTIISSTGATTIVAAQGSGVFADITSILLSNSSATATKFTLSDGTKTRVFYLPAGDMRGISLTVPYAATTANTVWTGTTATSVASVDVSVDFVLNK